MPKLTKGRSFAPDDTQRVLAKRELRIFLDALSHDTQFAIRHACWLIEVVHLPKRVTRQQAIAELAQALALYREQLASNPTRKWIGRPWTEAQLKRAYYAKGGKFRDIPHPVTREELLRWTPTIPPIEMKRRRLAAKEA